MTETYKIKLPAFEGPFDLLLFFIERDELDIHDIPISKITDDFLSYIREMELLNIDLASEFIVVAASLCRIKAKLLLPRKAVDEEGNEIDPREELVQRLLEYQRYKDILEEMRSLEQTRAKQQERGNRSDELKKIAEKALVDAELESVTLFKLLRTFERLLTKQKERERRKIVHRIIQYPYTIQGQRDYIFSTLRQQKGRISFDALFQGITNRIHAIVTFLALLELLNGEELMIQDGLDSNNFWVDLPKVVS
ncbi:MAG: segregation/condensation protein A [Bacteroidota bacterium]